MGEHRWSSSAAVGDLIRGLARQRPDAAIAATLNRCNVSTGKGNSWTEACVRSFRGTHGIAVHRRGEMAERGELKLEEAAELLQVSKMTVLRLIGSGSIVASQVCKGAPWATPRAQWEGLDLRSAPARPPRTEAEGQAALDFQ